MSNFFTKQNKIAQDTDKYLRRLISNQKKNSFLVAPMRYGLFPGGKRLRSAILINT